MRGGRSARAGLGAGSTAGVEGAAPQSRLPPRPFLYPPQSVIREVTTNGLGPLAQARGKGKVRGLGGKAAGGQGRAASGAGCVRGLV